MNLKLHCIASQLMPSMPLLFGGTTEMPIVFIHLTLNWFSSSHITFQPLIISFDCFSSDFRAFLPILIHLSHEVCPTLELYLHLIYFFVIYWFFYDYFQCIKTSRNSYNERNIFIYFVIQNSNEFPQTYPLIKIFGHFFRLHIQYMIWMKHTLNWV